MHIRAWAKTAAAVAILCAGARRAAAQSAPADAAVTAGEAAAAQAKAQGRREKLVADFAQLYAERAPALRDLAPSRQRCDGFDPMQSELARSVAGLEAAASVRDQLRAIGLIRPQDYPSGVRFRVRFQPGGGPLDWILVYAADDGSARTVGKDELRDALSSLAPRLAAEKARYFAGHDCAPR